MDMEIHRFLGEKHPAFADYPLMDSPKRTVVFSLLYLLFVKYIGPTYMKNRKPFDLRVPMIVYNLFLVCVSSFVFLGLGFNGWFTSFNWRCEPIDYTNSPKALKLVFICWVFYISKLLEYMDTIFFVLRKKDNQINFLHVFHHSTVPVTSWLGVSYGPGGYNTIFVLLNSFVHIWMYLYYGLSAVGPRLQKYLWWKKYLTSLQLVQFVGIFLYFMQLLVFPSSQCQLSPFLTFLSLSQAVLYFGLFLNFFFRTYKKLPKKYTSVHSKQENGYKTS